MEQPSSATLFDLQRGKKADHVVVDVEIQLSPDAVEGGWDATDKLLVSVAVVYEHLTDRFRVYWPDDVPELRKRLLAADRVSGFNIWKFDFPVIWGVPRRAHDAGDTPYQSLLPRTNDILRRIWQARNLNPDIWTREHGGWNLDAITKGTLGADQGKIGHGAKAPEWWQKGEHGKVVTYCLDDVRLERDLAAFVDRHGFVVHETRGLLRV